ncbi:hypothetical protein LZ30DRAFT_734212, partial [Colletotrichum cereale]
MALRFAPRRKQHVPGCRVPRGSASLLPPLSLSPSLQHARSAIQQSTSFVPNGNGQRGPLSHTHTTARKGLFLSLSYPLPCSLTSFKVVGVSRYGCAPEPGATAQSATPPHPHSEGRHRARGGG